MGCVCLQGLALLPELTSVQQGSVPASAASTFSAAVSSPTALRAQVRHMCLLSGKVWPHQCCSLLCTHTLFWQSVVR